MKGKIYITGIIGSDITAKMVQSQLALCKDADALDVYIGSNGGCAYEAEAIIDVLSKQNKPIDTYNVGNVMSAGTKIFLIGNNRYFNPSIGAFLIHNPHTEIQGDSASLKQASLVLNTWENKYIKDYSKILGLAENIISEKMKEDRYLTVEEIESMGIAKIVRTEVKAIFNLNNHKMKKNDKNLIEILASKLKEIGGLLSVSALVLQDANGNEIDFPEITTIEEIAVGVKVTIAGAEYTGEIAMEDGSIIVAENGVVTEIKVPQNMDEEVAALKEENETLKNQIAEINAKFIEANATLTEIKAQFSTKSPVTSQVTKEVNTNQKQSFTYKRK